MYYIYTFFYIFTVEREHVQKKTFTKWVNSHLSRINCRVADLYTDLRDGKLLIKLLEILSGERLVSLNLLWITHTQLPSWVHYPKEIKDS